MTDKKKAREGGYLKTTPEPKKEKGVWEWVKKISLILGILLAILLIIWTSIQIWNYYKEDTSETHPKQIEIPKTENKITKEAKTTGDNSPIVGGEYVKGDMIDTLNIFMHQDQKVSDLRLVDVGIEESDSSFPKIDIKLRNLGTEVVFLKKGVLRVIDKGILRNPAIVEYLVTEVSWNYDILLGEEKQIEKPISHAIQPNAVDRFTFTLAHDGGDPVFPTLFYIEVSLVYNEDDKTLISKPLLIPVPSTRKAIASTTRGYDKGIGLANINILKRFAAYEGIASETFREIMKNNTKGISEHYPLFN